MSSTRKLALESLELRQTCAGNVFANIVNHELVLTGDAQANYISVQQQVVGGVTKYVVRGLPFNGQFTSGGKPSSSSSDERTTINGFVQPFRVNAANVRLAVDLREGNDALVIGGDTNGVQRMEVPRLRVNTGTGEDYLRVRKLTLSGDANDFSTLYTTASDGSSPSGQAEPGHDKLEVESVQVVNTDLRMGTGGGNDHIFISNVHHSTAETDIFLFAGNGNDRLNLFGSDLTTGRLTARMGEGRDSASVGYSEFTRALVDMGGGASDHLEVSGMRITGQAFFDGGDGTGDLIDSGDNNTFTKPPIVRGFETNNL